MADETGKLASVRLGVFDYDFSIIHPAGVKQQVADALLRLSMEEKNNYIFYNELQKVA